MCAVLCPSRPRKSVRTSAKPAGSGGGPEGVKGGEAPKPGRSTAMTLLRAASRSRSGSQIRRLLPVPWTSSRGSPVPRTSWCRSCSMDGLDAVVLIVLPAFLLCGEDEETPAPLLLTMASYSQMGASVSPKRVIFTSIHRSAWKVNCTNFAFTAFSEVRVAPDSLAPSYAPDRSPARPQPSVSQRALEGQASVG